MTPVSFVKTTKSYDVSLVSINRQTSFDFSVLRQDYGIIRSLPVDHTGHHLDIVVVVVVLLFYVHGKHLRSCRDGQLT